MLTLEADGARDDARAAAGPRSGRRRRRLRGACRRRAGPHRPHRAGRIAPSRAERSPEHPRPERPSSRTSKRPSRPHRPSRATVAKWYINAMRTTIDKAGRVVIPASIRERGRLIPRYRAQEITLDEFGIHLERVAAAPRLMKVGRRLVARPTVAADARPVVDIAALIEEEAKPVALSVFLDTQRAARRPGGLWSAEWPGAIHHARRRREARQRTRDRVATAAWSSFPVATRLPPESSAHCRECRASPAGGGVRAHGREHDLPPAIGCCSSKARRAGRDCLADRSSWSRAHRGSGPRRWGGRHRHRQPASFSRGASIRAARRTPPRVSGRSEDKSTKPRTGEPIHRGLSPYEAVEVREMFRTCRSRARRAAGPAGIRIRRLENPFPPKPESSSSTTKKVVWTIVGAGAGFAAGVFLGLTSSTMRSTAIARCGRPPSSARRRVAWLAR